MTLPAGVTSDMLGQLRRMVNEPSTTPYTDDILGYYIALHPCTDTNGYDINENDWLMYLDYSNSETSYADLIATGALPVWTPTWDLHAAAADVWEEKAALVQNFYDFSADGAHYSQQQVYQQAMEQVKYHLARRKPQNRATHKSPVERRFEVLMFGLATGQGYDWWMEL